MVCLAATAAAQAPAGGAASPLLPPGHWAVEAARRAEALGLAPEYLPAQRAVTRGAVAAALRGAAERAGEGNGAWGALADGWWARFGEEFPEYGAGVAGETTDSSGGLALLGGSAAAGVGARRGVAAPGEHEFFPDRTGATAMPDRTEGVARLEVAGALGPWAAAHAAPVAGTHGLELERGEIAAGWRRLRLSVGRAEVGYGVGAGGGVMFSGNVPLDRVEVSTAEAVRLPSVLRWLGPFAYQGFAAVLPERRHPGRPWLVGMTASAKPHPRFTLSGHRGLMLGGDHAPPVRASELPGLLIGKNVLGVDQIASTSFRLRLPTEGLVPLAVYCEWGAEDSSGGPFRSPGLLCGGVASALPGLPAASLGLEHVQFGARPERGPPWYRHHMFPGNWAMDKGTLGHPLGGEGRQWLLYSRADLLRSLLRLDGRAFHSRRGGENLYLPGREGKSAGFSGRAAWRFRPDSEVRLGARREAGDGWAETAAHIDLRVLF